MLCPHKANTDYIVSSLKERTYTFYENTPTIIEVGPFEKEISD